MAANAEDLFRVSCDRPQNYPKNLLGVAQYGPSVEGISKQLSAESKRLWKPDSTRLQLLELYAGDNEFQETSLQSPADTKTHFERRKDPRWRFAFVGGAKTGRAKLNCSENAFRYVATYHQISPGFVSHVLSFGPGPQGQKLPLDFNLMTFEHEDTLYARDEELNLLPSLGRSGREIRLFFNLRTVEPTSYEAQWKWSVRNVAVYLTFDVLTGRSFWMNIKANDLMKERISNALNMSQRTQFKAKTLESAQGSFAATLETLWIYFDWSDEHWRHCINALDQALQAIIVMAKTATVDQYAQVPGDLMKDIKRRVTSRLQSPTSANSVVQTAMKRASTLTKPFHKSTWTDLIFKETSPTSNSGNAHQPSSGSESDGEQDQRVLDELSELKDFTFDKMQNLHSIGERINEYLLIVQQTIHVVREVTRYYEETFEASVFPQPFRDHCRPDMALFRRRMKNLERNLTMRRMQLESMARLAQEGKGLFDGIFQSRNIQISLLFTQSGYDSGKKMEKIAQKTEQETTSMHIITFVTLLFLPGTFIATFFQSGIIQLNHPDTIEQDWIFLDDAWGLFAKITFPMMAIIFVIWIVVFQLLRCRAKRAHDNSNNV